MVTVAVTGDDPERLIAVGDTAQKVPPYVVLQLKFTVPVNPPRGVKVIVDVPDCPGADMMTLVGLYKTLKSVTVTAVGVEVEAA